MLDFADSFKNTEHKDYRATCIVPSYNGPVPHKGMDSHERAITTEDGEKKIHPEACVEDFENKDVEHTLKHDLETEDRKALFVVREDLGRQLGLASDRQNATLQSIGILVAFASILFLQLLAMDPVLERGGIFSWLSMGSVLLCSIVGILTILKSSNFALSTGMGAEDVMELYEMKKTDDLEIMIAHGVNRAYRMVYRNNAHLNDRITYMVVLLLLGIFTGFAGWCIG